MAGAVRSCLPPPRHRRARRGRGGLLGAGSDRLQPEPVAAGGEPGEHPFQAPCARGSRCRRTARRRPTASSPEPSIARIRGRSTGIRRPPKVTEPAPRPCRTAARSGSWRPLGPHTAVTSASMSAAITCNPVPTARASRPSRSSPASSPSATLTCSGAAAWLVSISSFWHCLRTAVPCLVVFLAVHPSAYRTAGLRWGTATSTSTRSGTTSGSCPETDIPKDLGTAVYRYLSPHQARTAPELYWPGIGPDWRD